LVEDLELPRRLAVVIRPQNLVRYCPFRSNHFLQSESMGVQLLRKTEKVFEINGSRRLFLGNASFRAVLQGREDEYLLRSVARLKRRGAALASWIRTSERMWFGFHRWHLWLSNSCPLFLTLICTAAAASTTVEERRFSAASKRNIS
jgi:hypothetical protein